MLTEDVPGRIQCFGCRETGHTRRDCPKVKSGKCFKCGQMGHYSRDCGKNLGKSSENVSSSTANTNASGSKAVNTFGNMHDKYLKNAILKGYQLPSYVDLGSSVVALREGDAKRLNLTFKRDEIEDLVGYGNRTMKPLETLVALLSVDNVEARVEIHIVPDNVQAVPLLIGHPYTEQQHMV